MIFVSWSVAYDTIISTVGTFASNARGDQWSYNLSLFAPRVRVASGGTGHNIAYNLWLLWHKDLTHLVACVGHDFDYVRHADVISYDHLTQDDTALTWHAYMINDESNAQIISFHPWALWSGLLTIPDHQYQYAIIAPNDKPIMIAHVHAAKATWATVFFDPGQQLWLFSKQDLVELQSSIDYLICNQPESEQIASLFDTTTNQLHTIFPWIIITKGEEGVDYRDHGVHWHVPCYTADQVVDPTWAGDALRWWLLSWLIAGHDLKKSLEYGSIMWSLAVQHQWTMEHHISIEELRTKHQARIQA